MNLDKNFEDILSILNKREVEYMVVGGYALAFHGKPRNTGDLDIWINVSDTNATKMVNVLREFNGMSVKKEDFLRENGIIQMGFPPFRIDIVNDIDGVSFKEAIKNTQVIKVGDLTIPFIGLKEFIKNKEAVGRAKDLSDIKEVKKISAKKSRRKGI